MNDVKKLEQLLKEDVLKEVNNNIEELEKQLEKKNKKTIHEELKYMQDVKRYFDEALEDIRLGKMTENDAFDILVSLEGMQTDNQDI